MDVPCHEAIRFKCLQSLGQHLFADPANCASQLAEPEGSIQEEEKYQRAPAGSDMPQNGSGGAVCGAKVPLDLLLKTLN